MICRVFIIVVFLAINGFATSCQGSSHQDVTKKAPPNQRQDDMIRILALGDSYTKGESIKWGERWPLQLVTKLREQKMDVDNPLVVAETGWTTTDLMKAIEQTILVPPYDVVTLLIGVNDQFQGYSEENYASNFKKLLLKAITLTGGSKDRVIVISIPDYGITPFGKRFGPSRIRSEIDRFNEINKKIAENKGVDYVNVTEISRRASEDPTLLAPDGLHPSAKMYAEWVELIVPVVKSSLQK